MQLGRQLTNLRTYKVCLEVLIYVSVIKMSFMKSI